MTVTDGRRTAKWIVLGFILLFIVGYSIFSARHLIEGPIIEIESPSNYQSFDSSFIQVTGTTENTSYISLNGKAIYIDESGRFSEQILLSPGANDIHLYAKDRFGREIEKQIKVNLQNIK